MVTPLNLLLISNRDQHTHAKLKGIFVLLIHFFPFPPQLPSKTYQKLCIYPQNRVNTKKEKEI
ncbi:hypothetical protein LguiA_019100 [Lonicera macranthoides]